MKPNNTFERSGIFKKSQTMRQLLFCLMVLATSGVGSSKSEATEVITGMKVLVVSKGDIKRPDKAWFYPASGMLLNEKVGNLFMILPEDSVWGKKIEDGGYVRIRLAEEDRWTTLSPRDGKIRMFSGSRGVPANSLLQVKRIVYTRPGRGVVTSGPIMLDDPFSLRLANQDVWLKISADYKEVVPTSNPREASYFIFAPGGPLPKPEPAPKGAPTQAPTPKPPVLYGGIPMSQGHQRPPAISCNGGILRTSIPCDPCTTPGWRQTRSHAQCTEALDIHGRGCSGRSCESCTCQPN